MNEPKYQFVIRKWEDVRIKHLHDPKAFIKYSQYMDDVYNNVDDYNPNKKKLWLYFMMRLLILWLIKNFMS